MPPDSDHLFADLVTIRDGEGIAIVHGAVRVLLSSESASRAESVWTALSHEESLSVVLDTVVASGLAGLGSFAIAVDETPDRSRLLVRGAGRAVTLSSNGLSVIEPKHAHTWLECTVDGAATIGLWLDPAARPTLEGARETGKLVRLDAGLAPAEALSWNVGQAKPLAERNIDPAVTSQRSTEREQVDPEPEIPPAVALTAEATPGVTIVVPSDGSLEEIAERRTTRAPEATTGDGATIVRPRARRRNAKVPVEPTKATSSPMVQAVMCVRRHPNPTHALTCFVCGDNLGDVPELVARPVLGELRFSDGRVVELDTPIVIGTGPGLRQAFEGEQPKEVVFEASTSVAERHTIVRIEGWHAYIEDLGSPGGTLLTLPGRDPIRLRPGDAVPLELGSRVDLGDEAAFDYVATSGLSVS